MIHKFKRWRNSRKYDEAYLEMQQDRVVETKKTRREEIGALDEKSPDDVVIQTDMIDGVPESKVEEGGDEFSEDERVVDRPKSKWSFFRPLFWLVLLGTTFYYFVPYMNDLLNQDLNTYEPTTVENVAEAEGVASDEKQEDEEQSVDIEGQQKASGGLVEDFEQAISESKKNFSTDINLTDREVNVYASVHTNIVRNTKEFRDVIQNYISGDAQHVQMASKGGRIDLELNRLKAQLSRVEDSEIKTLLTRRIERLSEISLAATRFNRETALTEMNSFITAENAESQTFINMFTTLLKQENIPYEIREGSVYFK